MPDTKEDDMEDIVPNIGLSTAIAVLVAIAGALLLCAYFLR